MAERLDVIGAGIAGLAHAWNAAKAGWKVRVFERDPIARSASVRNFGMVWPIGQAADKRSLALRSRELWSEIVAEAKLWHNPCGSLHAVRAQDELDVIEEFCAEQADGLEVSMLSPDECVARGPYFRREGLLGGLFSATEMCVNPRQVISSLPSFLTERFGVEFHFAEPVLEVDTGRLQTSRGNYQNDVTVVCSGADFETLFPEVYEEAGITRCKLQMMRAAGPASGKEIGVLMAAGLTLLHYKSFENCKTLAALRERFTAESPHFLDWGVHVMVSQHDNAELTIGDSHEYNRRVSPFNRTEVDQAILDYLNSFAHFPDLEIVERWNGVYPKLLDTGIFMLELEPVQGVRIFNGLGGAGMTLSFGASEDHLRRWLQTEVAA